MTVHPGASPVAMVFEGIDPHTLAETLGTPCHVYSVAAIRARIAGLHAALQALTEASS